MPDTKPESQKQKHEKAMCAHPGCRCERAADSIFCSPYCESMEDVSEEACECGHPACTGAART